MFWLRLPARPGKERLAGMGPSWALRLFLAWAILLWVALLVAMVVNLQWMFFPLGVLAVASLLALGVYDEYRRKR